MTIHSSRSLLIAIFMSIVLMTTACVPIQPRQAEGAVPTNLTKLKVLLLPFLSFAPYFIAQEEGYFAEQGLEIEFVQMQQGTEAIPALVQGQIDVYGGFINVGLLNAMATEDNIKVVADKGYLTTEGCAPDVFMISMNGEIEQQLSDPAQRPDLHFSANVASVEGYFISKILAPHDLTLADIQIDYIADAAAELDALGSGAIDVAIVSEPWVTRISQAGAGQVWQRISDSAPAFQSGVVVFGPTLLNQNPDAGRRFMTAYLKGLQQFAEGKTERNVAIIAQYTNLDPALLQDLCWTAFQPDGKINAESIVEFAQWANVNKYLDTVPTIDQIWDSTFVDSAHASLVGAK